MQRLFKLGLKINFLVLFILSWSFAGEIPPAVNLGKIQESSWLAEGHRLRLMKLTQTFVDNDLFMTKLCETFSINWKALPPNLQHSFKINTVFRMFAHDFAKSSIDQAYVLAQYKGVDIAKLHGTAKVSGFEKIKNLNEAGGFFETDIHKFIFARDEYGKLWPEKKQNLNALIEKVSSYIEHSVDLMDRHMASLVEVNKEWNRPMVPGAQWLDQLLQNMDKGLVDPHGLSREELLGIKNASSILESHVNIKDYKQITKGLSVKEYYGFRLARPTLDYSEILKLKDFRLKIPTNIQKYMPDTESLDRPSIKIMVENIQKELKVGGKVLTALNTFGKLATGGQVIYAGFVFYKTRDLGAGLAAALYIQEAGSRDEVSLSDPHQLQLFFSQSTEKQIQLLQQEPRFLSWLQSQFLTQPVATQMQLICKDNSLSSLLKLQCLSQVNCDGDYPKTLTVLNQNSNLQTQRNYRLTYSQSHLTGQKHMDKLEVLENNKVEHSTLLNFRKQNNALNTKNPKLDQKYFPMRHWILINKDVYARACKYQINSILNPLKSLSSNSSGTALKILLEFLKTQNSEVISYPGDLTSAK